MQIYYGDNIQQSEALLQPVEADEIAGRIRGDASLRDDIERMRRVKAIDQKAYGRLKVRLPYFCCSRFTGNRRRAEFFEGAMAFVVDIDGCGGSAEELKVWKQRIKADERVWWLFDSPGGDGLKVVLRLASLCGGAKPFSDFYKAFAYEFAAMHGLADYIDHRTFDCTRVCFLSYDPGMWVNPTPQPIFWESYHTTLNLAEAPAEPSLNESHHIRPDVYAEILKKLETQARPRPAKELYIPKALNWVLPEVRRALEAQHIEILIERDIQFGKKLELQHGKDFAEINLFYGKKGYSVVLVPKRTHHEHLGKLVVFLAEQAILGPEHPTNDELPW